MFPNGVYRVATFSSVRFYHDNVNVYDITPRITCHHRHHHHHHRNRNRYYCGTVVYALCCVHAILSAAETVSPNPTVVIPRALRLHEHTHARTRTRTHAVPFRFVFFFFFYIVLFVFSRIIFSIARLRFRDITDSRYGCVRRTPMCTVHSTFGRVQRSFS